MVHVPTSSIQSHRRGLGGYGIVLPPDQQGRWRLQWIRLCELEFGVKLVGCLEKVRLVGSSRVAMARLTALLLLPVLFEAVFSISFYLPVNSRKCLREEIHKDVLVTGEYEIAEQANTKTNLKVSSDLRILRISVNVSSWNWGEISFYCVVLYIRVGHIADRHDLISTTLWYFGGQLFRFTVNCC